MPAFTDLLFFAFAGLTLLFGFLCVANPLSRNPVTSAMFLVLTIVSMAGLFVLLHAFFLAAVQILVYAGAVMVLFLFVIMLLDLGEEERRKLNRVALVSGSAAVIGLAVVLGRALLAAKPMAKAGAVAADGDTGALGRILFQSYLLPFEILSILLLVAMVGVILLSKKESR
ncbi:MAG: NADH-quinone oxidoreductase subunit J [Verrucomicrobia bacterium]|nr:MAG: NADH-quinone oxidoreductase subunit J [Verrucomicrobiota bacterium]